MPLLRLPEPFDDPEWLFEVKHDGFRALAHIDGHHCDLVSRNGHTFKHWPHLWTLVKMLAQVLAFAANVAQLTDTAQPARPG